MTDGHLNRVDITRAVVDSVLAVAPDVGSVGAETFLFGSVELEQSLTSTWSLVGFLDTVSFAAQLKDYPFDESLFSTGGGLRWKTMIGPVRLEYGYNLNRRPHDPVGTVQFSLGFPF